jgi:glycosyltransferase involved in cell wall biosynthesis
LKKNRLLIFCPGYPSNKRPINGIFTQRAVLALSENFDVDVIELRAFNFVRNIKTTEIISGINVYRVSILQLPNFDSKHIILFNSFLLSKALPLIFGKTFFNSFDYFHSTMLFPTSLVVSSLAWKFGKKHIAQGIGDDINYKMNKLIAFKWVENRFKLIDGFQFNSTALETKFKSMFPFNIFCFVLHRGVDLNLFRLKPEKAIRKNGMRFLFLGGVQDSRNVFSTQNFKGIHILLEAWSRIDKLNVDANLIIGGPGSTISLFNNWIKNLNHPDRITIIESILPKNISDLLCNVEVVVIPSLAEGLPNLANEAQASGTMVIASRVGGIPETVIDNYSGFLIDSGNADGFVAGILKVVNNPEMLIKFRHNGRKNMEDNFSWENYASKIKEKYTEI